MSDTARFNLPLLDAAQAQKHVTINEALVRADALAAMSAKSRSVTTPPPAPIDGEMHIVGTGASGAWAGSDDEIAIFLNGGWEFITPWPGCSLWLEDEGSRVVFDGIWIADRVAGASGGAVTMTRVLELDHALALAASSTTPIIIPDKAVVFGVSGRVIQAITGADGWSLGVPGSPDRYGIGYGKDLNSYAQGVSGQPLTYYGGTELLITAEGGNFTGGEIRLAVHFLEIQAPRPV